MRLPREVFFWLCEEMKKIYPGPYGDDGLRNYRLALIRGAAATPQSGPITLELKLCITLRLLAGASYLDMIWYGVQISSVQEIFLLGLHLINNVLANSFIFNFDPSMPGFNVELKRMATEWSAIMMRKKGSDLMKGTILAGDGMVVAIDRVSAEDLERAKLNVSDFRNRKGVFALILQAFCDAYCEFRHFEVNWPGSTNDSTAYRQTSLYSWLKQGLIPPEFHLVYDEAIVCLADDHHLTPFTRHQLRGAVKSENMQLYERMKAFNHILSSQRITIERAFGMLVRKWLILCSPLEHSLEINILILTVCAKLHNLSIRHWKREGKRAEEVAQCERLFQHRQDAGIFCGWAADGANGMDMGGIADEDIRLAFGNFLPNGSATRKECKRRVDLMNNIFDKGHYYPAGEDVAFELRGL
jgi:hypothetical protein